MILRGVVENGVVRLPANVRIPDGTVVRIEVLPRTHFADLIDLAGTWQGDDAESAPDHTTSVLEVAADRAAALSRLRAGIEAMNLHLPGPPPSRDELHEG